MPSVIERVYRLDISVVVDSLFLHCYRMCPALQQLLIKIVVKENAALVEQFLRALASFVRPGRNMQTAFFDCSQTRQCRVLIHLANEKLGI